MMSKVLIARRGGVAVKESRFGAEHIDEGNQPSCQCATVRTDSLGIITDFNDRFLQLSGAGRVDLIGSPLKDLFVDPHYGEETLRLVLRSGRVSQHEVAIRSKSGREFVLSVDAETVRDSKGELTGVFISGANVTAHKQLEQHARESNDYHRGIIEAAADGMMVVDAAGHITDVNEAVCKISGRARDGMIGASFFECFADPRRARAIVAEVLRKGSATDCVMHLIQGDCGQSQVSLNCSVLRKADGTPRGMLTLLRDVTGQAGAQAKILRQVDYNRSLIESSLDAIMVVDPTLTITDVNESACKLLGRARPEILGTPFVRCFAEPLRAAELFSTAVEKKTVEDCELSIRSADDSGKLAMCNASALRDADGKLQGVAITARDISGPANLQAQLIEQQAYTRSLIECTPDALFVVAMDGTILDVNATSIRISGYPHKRLIGSRFSSFFAAPQQVEEMIQHALSRERTSDCELILVSAREAQIEVSCSAGVLRDASQRPTGIFITAREITIRKKLEHELRDKQLYIRSILDNSADAMVVTDSLGILTDCNQQMQVLAGEATEALVGTPLKKYFTEPKQLEEAIRRVLHDGRISDCELTARSKGGKEVAVSLNATTFNDQNGKLFGIVATVRDVTERKRFEETLHVQNVELERASNAKDQFLATMSHELRTPLNSIIGFTGTLMMKLPGPLTEDQESQLATIRTSADHLLSLINDLLDIARINSGKIELKTEETVCGEMLREVAATMRPMAEKKGLEFEILLPEPQLMMESDRRAVMQIAINLIGNAIKYTDSGKVSAEISSRTGEKHKEMVLSVTDTGRGISLEDQRKLFRPFEQLGDGPQVRGDGTGLGLHLSQKLAHLLGGSIVCDSQPGKGSKFTLILPQKVNHGGQNPRN